MAGADALGEFVSLDAEESFAIEYWPLELYKLAQAPPPGELQGRVALVTGGAGGIGGAIGDALAAAGACVVAFDLDLAGAEEAVAAYGDAGLAVSGDVTSEDAVAAAFAAAVERFGGRRHRRLQRGRRVERRARGHDARGMGAQPPHPRHGLLPRRPRRRSGCSRPRAAAARSCSSRPRTRSWPARTRRPTPRPRPRSSISPAAWPRRAAPTASASTRSTRTRCCRARASGARSWRQERADAYGIEPDELEEYYRRRTTLGVNIYPQDIAEAVLHFASAARSGKSTGNVLNVDGGVPAAYSR